MSGAAEMPCTHDGRGDHREHGGQQLRRHRVAASRNPRSTPRSTPSRCRGCRTTPAAAAALCPSGMPRTPIHTASGRMTTNNNAASSRPVGRPVARGDHRADQQHDRDFDDALELLVDVEHAGRQRRLVRGIAPRVRVNVVRAPQREPRGEHREESERCAPRAPRRNSARSRRAAGIRRRCTASSRQARSARTPRASAVPTRKPMPRPPTVPQIRSTAIQRQPQAADVVQAHRARGLTRRTETQCRR